MQLLICAMNADACNRPHSLPNRGTYRHSLFRRRNTSTTPQHVLRFIARVPRHPHYVRSGCPQASLTKSQPWPCEAADEIQQQSSVCAMILYGEAPLGKCYGDCIRWQTVIVIWNDSQLFLTKTSRKNWQMYSTALATTLSVPRTLLNSSNC